MLGDLSGEEPTVAFLPTDDHVGRTLLLYEPGRLRLIQEVTGARVDTQLCPEFRLIAPVWTRAADADCLR